jgi:hypothetical protein
MVGSATGRSLIQGNLSLCVCVYIYMMIVGLNPTWLMYICLLCALCVVRWKFLRRADLSSRGICVCMTIAGSNPTWPMYICLLWVFCVVRWMFLRRADLSSRGICVCVCVCVCVSWGATMILPTYTEYVEKSANNKETRKEGLLAIVLRKPTKCTFL